MRRHLVALFAWLCVWRRRRHEFSNAAAWFD